jgi:hypothetical protein
MRRSRFLAFALVLTSCCSALAGKIHEAVHENDIPKVKKLIQRNPDLIFAKDLRMDSRLYTWRRRTATREGGIAVG